MTAMLSGPLAVQRHDLDLRVAAAGRVALDLRRSRTTQAAVARARIRLSDALARSEARDRQMSVAALAP